MSGTPSRVITSLPSNQTSPFPTHHHPPQLPGIEGKRKYSSEGRDTQGLVAPLGKSLLKSNLSPFCCNSAQCLKRGKINNVTSPLTRCFTLIWGRAHAFLATPWNQHL